MTSILTPNALRITSVGLPFIKHSKTLFGINLKQVSYINLRNHIALLYALPSNILRTDPTAITPDSIVTSPSPVWI